MWRYSFFTAQFMAEKDEVYIDSRTDISIQAYVMVC